MNMKKEFSYQEYVQRELNILRAPYNPELEFYSKIKNGKVDEVRELLCKEPFVDKPGLGKLSDDPLQNMKYHFTVTVAMVARYCIDGGMEVAVSYSLSDFYINKADKSKSIKEISELHRAMSLDYTKRMKSLRKKKITSIHIVNCLDYIYDHLHTRITVETLAKREQINPTYLSRLFKAEVGCTISQYIQEKKIETAQNMLIYSNYTPAQISTTLAFPSQSYFTEVFKKNVGTTPSKYRAAHIHQSELGRKSQLPG